MDTNESNIPVPGFDFIPEAAELISCAPRLAFATKLSKHRVKWQQNLFPSI